MHKILSNANSKFKKMKLRASKKKMSRNLISDEEVEKSEFQDNVFWQKPALFDLSELMTEEELDELLDFKAMTEIN